MVGVGSTSKSRTFRKMPSFERESFKLLELSESGSEALSDLDLAAPVPVARKSKKKVRLKRRDRNGRGNMLASTTSVSSFNCYPDRLLSCPCLPCDPLTLLLTSVITSLAVGVVVLAYFTSTLHNKMDLLNKQLQYVDDGSKSIPDTLQMIHTKIETLRSNQSSVLSSLEELSKRIEQVSRDLTQVNQSVSNSVQGDVTSALHSVASLGGSVKELTDTINTVKNNTYSNTDSIDKINRELNNIKLNHIDLQNGVTSSTSTPVMDETRLDALEKKVGKMEVVVEENSDRVEIINSTVEVEHRNSSAKIGWIKEDVETLKSSLQQLQDDNNKVSSQVGTVKAECASQVAAGVNSLADVVQNITDISSRLNRLEGKEEDRIGGGGHEETTHATAVAEGTGHKEKRPSGARDEK